ncbi:hypothetical protein evm_008758 [Chilo suppressalis]|nr:hypothetical protein evm_008758 [Chilo suppressalis]
MLVSPASPHVTSCSSALYSYTLEYRTLPHGLVSPASPHVTSCSSALYSPTLEYRTLPHGAGVARQPARDVML